MIGTYAVLAFFVFFALYPISQIVTVSLRSGDRLLSTSLAFHSRECIALPITAPLFADTAFLTWLRNSALVALRRDRSPAWRWPPSGATRSPGIAFPRTGFGAPERVCSSRRCFRPRCCLLPLYLVLIKLQLINSFLGVVLIYTATALPFLPVATEGLLRHDPDLAGGGRGHRRLHALADVPARDPAALHAGYRHHGAILIHDGVERIRRGRPCACRTPPCSRCPWA